MTQAAAPSLSIIEGYYGRPWSWAARTATMRALAPHGYRSFIYAPKADPFLRRRWREPHPRAEAEEIARFAEACAEAGAAFGVGLSPFEIYRCFDQEARAALAARIDHLCGLGVRVLAILFDDMHGDAPGLADVQADILHWIADRGCVARLVMCPTYYSDDAALDVVFGERPAGYLEALGARLDPAIEVFWTGPEVCSRELTAGHLARVAGQLRRRPLLWDNYPVNDGPRMSRHLHLRAFTGRRSDIAPHIAGHAVNPASQPVLSRIPMLTLVESYREAGDYDYGQAFDTAAALVLGEPLARAVRRALPALQDLGLDGLDEAARMRLSRRFSGYDHPAAHEILDWLAGAWTITREEMEAS